MKKIFLLIAGIAALASCKSLKEEFDPVWNLDRYTDPAPYKPAEGIEANISIADFCALYTQHGKPLENLNKGYIISGIVSTTDQPGNFYKSFYMQDETGGIEIKIGKNGLYNDYKPGQTIYVKTDDLTLGEYGYGSKYDEKGKKIGNGNGMIQLGFYSPAVTSGTWYETSYFENTYIIDEHVFRGDVNDLHPVEPITLTESQLPILTDTQKSNSNLGKLVRLNGLTYSKEIFCLLYVDPSKDKSKYNPSNRVFLSNSNGVVDGDKTHKVSTWAMSKVKMTEHLLAGHWDECKVGSGSTFTGETVGDFRVEDPETGVVTYPDFSKSAYSISHYFKMGSTSVIIRTSGYAKFADMEMPAEVYAGNATIDAVGILTLYEGSIQLTVNSLADIYYNGEPLL